jgi:hypothetical protein
MQSASLERAQQVIGREGETATLLTHGLLTFGLRVVVSPRHFGRYPRVQSEGKSRKKHVELLKLG